MPATSNGLHGQIFAAIRTVNCAVTSCGVNGGIVTRENPIRRTTCNSAGAGCDRIVEIRPDPDSRIGYSSIPNFYKLIANSTCDRIFCVCTHIIVNSTPDRQLVFRTFKNLTWRTSAILKNRKCSTCLLYTSPSPRDS